MPCNLNKYEDLDVSSQVIWKQHINKKQAHYKYTQTGEHHLSRLSPAPCSVALFSLTLTTSSSVDRHCTASETSVMVPSTATVTTFTGTATVLPFSTAVFMISVSCGKHYRVRYSISSETAYPKISLYWRGVLILTLQTHRAEEKDMVENTGLSRAWSGWVW